MFSRKLNPDNTLPELLDILANATEFSELPVRHNEDKLNAELAELVPWPVDKYALDSPFVKTNLLFQCHFSRIPMPVADYKTDLRSVLEQAIRILQALIDVTAEFGFLGVTNKVMTLVQMVIQARWLTDSTLANLPGISPSLIHKLNTHSPNPFTHLPELMNTNVRQLNSTCMKLKHHKLEELTKVLKRLPRIKLNLNVRSKVIDAGGVGVISIALGRTQDNKQAKKGGNVRAWCPEWPKAKNEGWWLVVGMEEADELFALKRITIRGSVNTHDLNFEAPLEPGEYTYNVYLMSDSYIGLDQQDSFQVNVVAGAGDVGEVGVECEEVMQGEGAVGELEGEDEEYEEDYPSL